MLSPRTLPEIWALAPACAVHVRLAEDAVAAVMPNAAAHAWAARQGLAEPCWDALAERVRAAPDTRGVLFVLHAGAGEPRSATVRCTVVPLPDGLLLWLEPMADASAAPPAAAASAVPAASANAPEPAPPASLQGQLAFLDRAIQLAGVSVWRVDLLAGHVDFDGVGFRVAAMTERTTGIPLAAMRDSIHPDDRDAVLRAADEAVATGRAVDLVARYRNPDGSWRSLLTRRVAEFDAGGRAVALAGVSLDLDVLARDHARADRAGERTQLAAEVLGIGFWSLDADAGRVEWDRQMYRLYDRDPALGPLGGAEWLAQHVHEDDRAWLQARVERANAAWEPRLEAVFRTPPGPRGVRWIQVWTERTWRGGRRWVFGMHLDVTERQQAQASLQRERERTRLATVEAGVGVWERDADGRVAFWNEAMYRLRGLEPGEPCAVDDLARELVHVDDAPRLEALLREHLRHGAPYEAEFRVRHADGGWRWFETRGFLVRDAEGRVLGTVGINLDITARKEAEALQRDKERLAQASRDKSAFMARMSHELRTPLNAVLGFSRLLEDDRDEPPSARQRERLRRIGAAGTRLLALVDDMLELAAVEAEATPAAPVPVALDGVLDEALAELQPLLRETRVGIERVRGLPRVVAEPQRLRRALVLLLEIMVLRSARGTQVSVALGDHGDGAGGVGHGEAATMCLTLRDGGATSPSDAGASLFGPLLDPLHGPGGAPAEAGGAGLGNAVGVAGMPAAPTGTDDDPAALRLSLARGLLHAVGAEIRARQHDDGRSELCLRLPLAPPEPAAAEAAEPATAALQVLCVEDNPVNLMLVRELLALRPQVVLRTAEDAARGLASALAEPPDVALLDLQLPDLHGVELMRRMRAEPALARCHYIALSADAMPDHVSAALAAGFDAYWTKPIDFEHFIAGIDALAAAPRR